MKNFDIKQIDGIAFVLPKYDRLGRFVKIGQFAIFVNASICDIHIGFTILEAGVIIHIGPVFFGICHIKKQLAAFERLDKLIQCDK